MPQGPTILASNDVSGYRYYSCERCSGYWIPGSAIHLALTPEGSLQLLRLPPAHQTAVIPCPDCRSDCQSVTLHGCTLDLCTRCHGIWFDAGEVEQLKQLFPPGSSILDAESSRQSALEPPPGSSSKLLLLFDILITIISIR